MVRKRSRKYESDENDSDSDIDFDVNKQEPAPKKYSLRERRAPMFTTDFDYFDDEEEPRPSSDDDDFEVEAQEQGPQNTEGLIDFEDIIRADIVVNRNKIDYDNLIQKTEIKLTQPKRRGRKPKNWVPPPEPPELPKEWTGDGPPPLTTPQFSFESDLQALAELVPPEGLPNGDLENGVKLDPLEMSLVGAGEGAPVEQLPVEESVLKEEPKEEDDDVIVLGEVKQDVIVLDD